MARMEFDLKAELISLGANNDAIRLLYEPSYRLINYIDLIQNGQSHSPERVAVDAVVETHGQPLLYAAKLAKFAKDPAIRDAQVKKLSHELACRGSGSFLALVDPDIVSIYHNTLPANSVRLNTITQQDKARHLFIPDLALRIQSDELTIHDLLYVLLKEAADGLARLHVLGKDGALSLMRYALFSKMQIDSGMRTFEAEYPETLRMLSEILDRHAINLAHVPAVILTEVFDRLVSGRCTPHIIAKYMCDQAFPGISNIPVDQARILDPCAGAGTFLVLCFKRLVAEHWKANGARPNANAIQRILNEQVRGYDTNIQALKWAETCLYLTAFELAIDPPALAFMPLIGKVLVSISKPSPLLESLDPAIDESHDKQYDLVIGTPPRTPWTGVGSNTMNKQANEIIRQIAFKRDPVGLARIAHGYRNANKMPDLPYMWRAMEWAKPDGIIALSMHARIVFNRSDAVSKNRDALFKALRITGILDGTKLRHADIWPDSREPFCLMFAINRIPSSEDIFHFISSEVDYGYNERCRMRIDYSNAHPIQFAVLGRKPTLLKTLARGNILDADVMRRISEIKTISVRAYLSKLGLPHHGMGFKLPSNGQEGDGRYPALNLCLKPYLREVRAPTYFLQLSNVRQHLLHRYVCRPYNPEVFKGPILIMRTDLRPDRDNGCGIFAFDDIPFNDSFYGYSGQGHPRGEVVVHYLYVLSYSQFLYYTAIVGGTQYGVERDVFTKEDFDQFPLVPLEKLSAEQIDELTRISSEIRCGGRPWEKVDDWVATVYGLTKTDQQIIADTLEHAMPFSGHKNRSHERPTRDDIDGFSSMLTKLLTPFFAMTDEKIKVARREQNFYSWVFLDVFTDRIDPNPNNNDMRIISHALADNEGASVVKVKTKEGHLVLGIQAQRRYWTQSHAKMLSLDILRHSSETFPVTAE